jgi:hypothetical protein
MLKKNSVLISILVIFAILHLAGLPKLTFCPGLDHEPHLSSSLSHCEAHSDEPSDHEDHHGCMSPIDAHDCCSETSLTNSLAPLDALKVGQIELQVVPSFLSSILGTKLRLTRGAFASDILISPHPLIASCRILQ